MCVELLDSESGPHYSDCVSLRASVQVHRNISHFSFVLRDTQQTGRLLYQIAFLQCKRCCNTANQVEVDDGTNPIPTLHCGLGSSIKVSANTSLQLISG